MNTELKYELITQKSSLGNIEKQYFISNSDVPAGYFDHMEENFFTQLNADAAPKAAKSISFWERTRISYSIAAVFALVIVGVSIFSLYRNSGMNALSQNEVVSYLEEEDELTSPSITPTVSDESKINLNELTTEEIKKYLMENEGIDVNNIN